MYNDKDILAQYIWHNENIKIENTRIFDNEWFLRGMRFIYDLVDINGQFMSFETFRIIFNLKNIFLTYTGVLHTVETITVIKISLYSSISLFAIVCHLNKSKGDS